MLRDGLAALLSMSQGEWIWQFERGKQKGRPEAALKLLT